MQRKHILHIIEGQYFFMASQCCKWHGFGSRPRHILGRKTSIITWKWLTRKLQQEKKLHFGCSLDNLDDVVAIAIKAEFHTTSLDGSGGGKELNDREKAKLEELYIASRSLVEPVELEHEVNDWRWWLSGRHGLVVIRVLGLILISKRIIDYLVESMSTFCNCNFLACNLTLITTATGLDETIRSSRNTLTEFHCFPIKLADAYEERK